MSVFNRIDTEICIKAYDALYSWFNNDSTKSKDFLIPVTTDKYREDNPLSGQQQMRVHAQLLYRSPTDRCDGFIAALTGPMLRHKRTLIVCFQGSQDEDFLNPQANELLFVRYPNGEDLLWKGDPDFPFDPQWPPHFPGDEMKGEPPVKPDDPNHEGLPYPPDLPITPPPVPSPPDTPSSPFNLEGAAQPEGFNFPPPPDFPPMPWPLALKGFFQYGWMGQGSDTSPRKEFWKKLYEAQDGIEDCKVLFTGFSRGGAFATYMFADAIWDYGGMEDIIGVPQPEFAEAKLYSFAAPATGELLFQYGFRKYRGDKGGRYLSFRIANRTDPIPPPLDIGYPIAFANKDGQGGHSSGAYEYLVRRMRPDASYESVSVLCGKVVDGTLYSQPLTIPSDMGWHPAALAVSDRGRGFYSGMNNDAKLMTSLFWNEGDDPAVDEMMAVADITPDERDNLPEEDQAVLRQFDPWYVNQAFDVDGMTLYWVLDGEGQSGQIHKLPVEEGDYFPLSSATVLERMKVSPPINFAQNEEADMAPVAFAVCDGVVYWSSEYGNFEDETETYLNRASIQPADDDHDTPYLVQYEKIYFRGNDGVPVVRSAVDNLAVRVVDGQPLFYFSLISAGFREHVLYRSQCEKSGDRNVLSTRSTSQIVDSGRDWNQYGFAVGKKSPEAEPFLFWSDWANVGLLSVQEVNSRNT